MGWGTSRSRNGHSTVTHCATKAGSVNGINTDQLYTHLYCKAVRYENDVIEK